MSIVQKLNVVRGMAGLALSMSATSFAAPAPDVVVPIRILPAPIITPPFVLPPDLEAPEKGVAPNRYAVVVGGAVAGDYEGSDHYVPAVVAGATARVHGHNISWHGNSLAVDLVPEYLNRKSKLILAPYVSLNPNRTSIAHDPVVALLGKRKVAIEGGGVIGFSRSGIFQRRFDSLTVQVAAAHDLGSVHRSFIVTPSVVYMAPLSKAALVTVSASADVVGAGYARYYFGIDSAANVASGLPVYRPSGGVKSASLGVGGLVSLRGDLRKGFAVGALLNYQRLLGAFADSPVVAMRGSPNQMSATLGVAYIF